MKEKGGEVCINRFSVNPSSLTHCDAVGGAGPAPRQTPVPPMPTPKANPSRPPGGRKSSIPIHPLRRLPAGLPYEFQSMPPYGGDVYHPERRVHPGISIHAPIRGRPQLMDRGGKLTEFQSMPPYGGDDLQREVVN